MTRLEFLRRSEKLTQTELARQIGYQSAWYLVQLEKYKPDPAAVGEELREGLEKRYGMTLEDLLTEVQLSEVASA